LKKLLIVPFKDEKHRTFSFFKGVGKNKKSGVKNGHLQRERAEYLVTLGRNNTAGREVQNAVNNAMYEVIAKKDGKIVLALFNLGKNTPPAELLLTNEAGGRKKGGSPVVKFPPHT
jgi:hypothetical protein